MASSEDLAELRSLAFQEQLIAWLKARQGEPGGDFAQGLYAGIHLAIRQLPQAIDDLLPGTLPVPYSEGCGCGPSEVCAPPVAENSSTNTD